MSGMPIGVMIPIFYLIKTALSLENDIKIRYNDGKEIGRVNGMKDVIHITGHKNPDTDSIVSAIAYAQLKRKQGINAVACRLGELNPETDFVLKKFKVPEPVYIQNARVKLYDVAFDEPIVISKDSTIKEAWDRMGSRSTSALFVVDHEQKLIGVVSLSDLSNILMSDKGERCITLMKNTSCENLRKVLHGEFVYECDKYHNDGRIHILCSKKAEYSDISYKDSIVVVNDDLNLQKRALRDGASCMILVDVDIISQGIIRMAKEARCTIIKTPLTMFQVARSMYRSPSVELIMKRKIISFNSHSYIEDVYQKMSKSRYRSYPVVNNQGVVIGAISRYHLLNYQKKKFILVDHNEMSQSIDNLEDAEVLEIVDHHRIGDVETTTPIRFRNEIIGSTCSIIALMYKEAGIQPDKEIAAIMCCAIISDTMNFNSPTTTPRDKEIAKELSAYAGVDLDEIAKEMFGAVATIKGRSMSEILYNDFKEYNIDGKRIAIGQINIADEQEIVDVQDEFKAYMEKINEINKFDLLMMCFTAADGSGSNLQFIGNLSNVVDEAFKDDILDDLYFVDGIISRKKQIIPTLSKCLENM